MTNRDLALRAALVLCAILMSAWLARPMATGPEQGVVKIVAGPTPPAVLASPAATEARPARIALVASQEDVDLADHQSWLAAREKRDNVWAARSEAAIGNQLRRIAYIGGRRRLEVKCAARLCEVIGIADPDPATNSYLPIWEALERDTAGNELGPYGLKRAAAIFDTGRIPEEFKIQYRRVDPVPASIGR